MPRLPHDTTYVANTPMTLTHKIDELLTISKIQISIERVLLSSEIIYRKVKQFEIQLKHWLGKLYIIIPLLWHMKVTENLVDSRHRWFHWAALCCIQVQFNSVYFANILQI